MITQYVFEGFSDKNFTTFYLFFFRLLYITLPNGILYIIRRYLSMGWWLGGCVARMFDTTTGRLLILQFRMYLGAKL